MRGAIFGLFTLALSAVVFAQASVEESRFEVVSIRPISAERRGGYRPTQTTFESYMPVTDLMALAYPGTNRTFGLPDWARTEVYEVRATMPAQRQKGDLGPMVRHMLDDRFGLRVHKEVRAIPVFELAMNRRDGRLGPNLKKVQRTCVANAKTPAERCSMTEGVGEINATAYEWPTLVSVLKRFAGRPIIDTTGLSGQFDLSLKWNHEGGRLQDGSAPADLELRATLFTALKEQLGLKLEPRDAPMEVLVIDRLERPTPN